MHTKRGTITCVHMHNAHASEGHMLNFIKPPFLDEQHPVFVPPPQILTFLQSVASPTLTIGRTFNKSQF